MNPNHYNKDQGVHSPADYGFNQSGIIDGKRRKPETNLLHGSTNGLPDYPAGAKR